MPAPVARIVRDTLTFSCAFLCACGAAPTPDPRAAELAAALSTAEPGEWSIHVPPLVAIGRDAEAALLTHLDRTGPGRQAVIAVLGRVGSSAAVPPLLTIARSNAAEAPEAALALGRLNLRGDPTIVDGLTRIVSDANAAVLTRVAAAASLLELGQSATAAPFLVAVLLADTPEGRAGARAHGLPDRPRWALERHIAIQAITRAHGETFGLDPDASWPALLEGARKFAARAGVERP